MARRKARTTSRTTAKPAARKKARGRAKNDPFTLPGWHIAWRVIIVAAVVGILWWQWPNITAWAASVRDETMRLFGWGLLLLIIALVILGIATWVRRRLPLSVRVRQWWGGIAFTIAIWGLLAYGALGGNIGQHIIGFPGSSWIGIPRIIGLVLLGVALVAPGAFVSAHRKTASWSHRQFERRPAPEPPVYGTQYRAPVQPPLAITPPPQPMTPPPAAAPTPIPIPTPTPTVTAHPIAAEKPVHTPPAKTPELLGVT